MQFREPELHSEKKQIHIVGREPSASWRYHIKRFLQYYHLVRFSS